jgi:hypothetical protein
MQYQERDQNMSVCRKEETFSVVQGYKTFKQGKDKKWVLHKQA